MPLLGICCSPSSNAQLTYFMAHPAGNYVEEDDSTA